MADPLPLRATGARTPLQVDGLALPPGRMPLLQHGRPLKRWRYAGVYGEDVMLCAAAVRIGPARQWFWAVWDRRAGALHDATRFAGGAVALPGHDALRIRARRVRADLALAPAGAPVEVVSRHGAEHIWTRKLPIRARGTVLAGGRAIDVDAAGLIDESAGYHARRTAWSWSAGVGAAADGTPVCWNLVDGVHDAPSASERTVWLDGTPAEPGPVTFAPDLSAIAGADGAALAFVAEAERARHDDLLVLASDYRQPFGHFAGTLPGGTELAWGLGVMERHDVRW